jgi:hypothetical protein
MLSAFKGADDVIAYRVRLQVAHFNWDTALGEFLDSLHRATVT